MILKLTNNKNTYSFEVEDLNNGEKLFYHFQIPTADMEDGNYKMVLLDGDEIVTEEQVCIGAYNPQAIQYSRGENVYINAPFEANLEDVKEVEITAIETTVLPSEGYDGIKAVEVNAQPIYDEGYNVGNADGIEVGKAEQKALLEPITITENGTYENENGYNTIEVNVPDTNGSYDEGYTDGYADGEAKGVENAGSIIAETARVLDITKNGLYVSKYSEIPTPDVITGVYADGTEFYNYAELNSKVYNTNITATPTTRLELWYKGNNTLAGDAFNVIIGAEKYANNNAYQIRYDTYSNTKIRVELGYKVLSYTWDENAWHHILIAKETEDASFMSLWVDEVKVGDFSNTSFNPQSTFYINSIESGLGGQRKANGCYGMIKIDDTIIIPTADGFRNTNTGELLEVVEEGNYVFTDNMIIPEGNLIKTVNVNVQPKINVGETGVKFAYSNFSSVPEWADFTNVTDISNMFRNSKLNSLKGIDFSKIQDITYAFYSCGLTNLDYFTPSNSLLRMNDAFDACGNLRIIPNMDLSSVLEANSLFENCGNIEEIGDINFENATSLSAFLRNWGNGHPIRKIGVFNVPNLKNIGDFFYYGFESVTRENLTEMGGFIGLKCNWDGGCGLDSCPNLTYQSCINILNGLADVTELGGRTLKVHPNFLTTVGEEISIGINKGWIITA